MCASIHVGTFGLYRCSECRQWPNSSHWPKYGYRFDCTSHKRLEPRSYFLSLSPCEKIALAELTCLLINASQS